MNDDLSDDEFIIEPDSDARTAALTRIERILSSYGRDTCIDKMRRRDLYELRDLPAALDDSDTVSGLSKDHLGTIYERSSHGAPFLAMRGSDVMMHAGYGCCISWAFGYARLTLRLLDNISVLPDFRTDAHPAMDDFRQSLSSLITASDRRRVMEMLADLGYMREDDVKICDEMEGYIREASGLFWNGTVDPDRKDAFADVYGRLQGLCVSYRIGLREMG